MSNFSRRTLVVGSAALPALNLPAGAGATLAPASPATDAVSFPALVAQFVRVRDRRHAQCALDRIYEDKLFELFAKAAGMSCEQYRALDHDDPRWQKACAVLRRIIDENPPPDNDPVDENGCSLAWSEVDNELRPLAEAMLNETPRSVTDLAWQAEALLTVDPELELDNGNLPRLFQNIFALAGKAVRS